jgi:hypothetical protein
MASALSMSKSAMQCINQDMHGESKHARLSQILSCDAPGNSIWGLLMDYNPQWLNLNLFSPLLNCEFSQNWQTPI